MRILFLTHRLPYAPNRGDRVRAYHILRQLRSWSDVDLLSLVHDEREAANAAALQPLMSSVTVVRVPRLRNVVRSLALLWTTRPTTHTMLDAPDLSRAAGRMIEERRPDVILAYCSGMARLALEPPLNSLPLVLDMVDVDSGKWGALAGTCYPPLSWIYSREARVLGRFEAAATRHAFATLVVTVKERDALRALARNSRIEVVQNGVDAAGLRPPCGPVAAPIVVFCGVMNYPPNAEGAIWLARQVWPLVRRHRPDAHLYLVGSNPGRAVRVLADARRGVSVTGHVADVRSYLWDAAVAAAPLLTARGVQNKVLEAVAAGLPAVVTPVVLDGLPVEAHPACVVADQPEPFADAIVALLDLAPEERRRRARQANLDNLSWERTLAPLRVILEGAAAAKAPHR